jgi:hypothetical protein
LKKTPIVQWIDRQLKADTALARRVESAIRELRREQDRAPLRERDGIKALARKRRQ